MELLNENEIKQILKSMDCDNLVNWEITNFSDEIVGYLSDHLTLYIDIELKNVRKRVKFFVKCFPRFDELKASYISEMAFFKKEYVMLSDLFNKFRYGLSKWRPEALFLKDNIFVFEDVAEMGYYNPNNRNVLTVDEIKACVVTLARFHAQSFILEENTSKRLGRPYRIWEEYNAYLTESVSGNNWRNVGKKAVIDFMKEYSQHRKNPVFTENVKAALSELYERAFNLMSPSSEHRNAVVHRDLWTNNIFLKKEIDGTINSLFIDFQTVIYCPPMMDLSSLLYFNTTRNMREVYTGEMLCNYYNTLSEELKASGVDSVMTLKDLQKSYEDSIPFAASQAALILSFTVIDTLTRKEMFSTPENTHKLGQISRSAEFIEVAKEDKHYRNRLLDLFDEITDRYVLV